jgi:hypothetical protein
MKTIKSIIVVLIVLSVGFTPLLAEDFTIYNKSSVKLTKMFAREKGKKQWSQFNIGSGIAPGKSVAMKWADHTDDSECVWEFKATFADGSQSNTFAIDTCGEHDIEFN